MTPRYRSRMAKPSFRLCLYASVVPPRLLYTHAKEAHNEVASAFRGHRRRNARLGSLVAVLPMPKINRPTASRPLGAADRWAVVDCIVLRSAPPLALLP